MMSEIPTYPDEIDPNIRIAALETQLAEERAKREAAENLFHRTHGVHHSWVAGYEQERERANRAERELAEERAAHARADAARANLRDKLDRLAAHSNGVADEAERWCVVAANWEGRAGKAEARVAELQALVDAATRFEWSPFVAWKTCDKWWLTDERDEAWSDQHRPQTSRDEAIALARDLAAKGKEPTR